MTITLDDIMDSMAEQYGDVLAALAKTYGAPKHGDPEYHRPRVTQYRQEIENYDAGRTKPSDVLGYNCRQEYADPKHTAREWLYKQLITELAMSKFEQLPVEPGQQVITWHTADEDSIRWDGVDPDRPDMSIIRLSLGLASGTSSSYVMCPEQDVAPVWMPLPHDKDERIDVQKLRKPGPWLAGNWRLHVPMPTGSAVPHEKWFSTKAKAIRYAKVWLAVLDFHAAVTEGVTDPWAVIRAERGTSI